MTEVPITAAEAAQQIGNLINSRSSSPRPAELEAIIAKVSAPVPEGGPAKDHIEYRAAAEAVDTWEEDDGDDKLDRLQAREGDLAEKIWARTAETWFDVLMLAEVALHHENGIMKSLKTPDDACADELAPARLIEAVIRLGRRQHG